MTTADRVPRTLATRAHELDWTSGLRCVLAVIVLVYHAVLTALPDGLPGQGQLAIQALGLVGRECVLVFVALSGYLLGRSWQKRLQPDPFGKPFRDFVARRSWRLLPAYWVALGLTILAMLVLGLDHAEGTHWDTGLPLTWSRAIIDALLLSDFAGEVPLSHPMWTVPVEMHLYLTAPLIAVLAGRFAVTAFACVTTLVVALLAPGFDYPFLIFAFITAYWTGSKARDPERPSAVRLLAPVIAVAMVQLVVVVGAGRLDQGPLRFFVADTVVWVLFVLWVYDRDNGDTGRRPLDVRVLRRTPLVWLGDRAYSFYLVHALALELCWRFVVVPAGVTQTALQVLAVVALGLVTTIAACEVFWRLVEEPTMRRSRQWSARAGATEQ